MEHTDLKKYHVTLKRLDGAHAVASSHGHTLILDVSRGDLTVGFNAAETLLASLGVCLITNVNTLAGKMRLQVDGVRIEVEGHRRDDPPGIVQVRYRLILDSPEPMERLGKLYDLAFKWGTVTNTLLAGVAIEGELVSSCSS